MKSEMTRTTNVEREAEALNGWMMLAFNLLLLLGTLAALVVIVMHGSKTGQEAIFLWLIPVTLIEVAAIVLLCGHFTLQPNEARVLILFGAYKGTVRTSGFWWANPFYSRQRGNPAAATEKGDKSANGHRSHAPGSITKLSLRARNFNSERLKVNDKRGNPIEIAAVVVWRVDDTAKAAFDVDDYESYVHIQSEAAVRHIASLYAYDRGDEHEPTLRESADEVASALQVELQERMQKAGVAIDEARLTHLAYAPEIAQAMLRRQQAEAVIAARQKIVHGAVSMVEMALRELSEKSVVQLDEERKAAMVSNLLVVLCGETEVTPVVNTGTLYQ
jgi:regulator of protease activity HflC (stomatin/prohibitin superfamily)